MIAVRDAWLRMLRKLAREKNVVGAMTEKNRIISRRPKMVP
jgi:hypothetical protein